MKQAVRGQHYLIISCTAHVGILLLLLLGFDITSTMPVIENTNQQDVISAVVLGDTAKSKILPNTPLPAHKSTPIVKEEPEKVLPKPTTVQKTIENDVIALKAAEKKKLADEKALEEKMRRELLEQDLLADIKKEKIQQKKIKQKQLTSQFEKTLKEQAEKSLRQQLLNEEIKLQGTQSRQAQGEINKYKALIVQVISQHWLIPPQVNKKLYCELMIRVAPGGMVLDVQVTKSSGDVALDNSARAAVLKSSPLPVPSDSNAFQAFRQFALKVKPENVLNDSSVASD